jgi:hypothetical protein
LLRRRRGLRLGRRSLLLCLLGLGLVSGGRRRRGLGGWLWLWLWLRLRVGAAIVEPPFGVEDAVIFRCKFGEQATREIELSVTAGRALVCYNGANLLAIVGDGDLLATDNRWVNRIAPELGTVDSDNLEIHRMNSRTPDTRHGLPTKSPALFHPPQAPLT